MPGRDEKRAGVAYAGRRCIVDARADRDTCCCSETRQPGHRSLDLSCFFDVSRWARSLWFASRLHLAPRERDQREDCARSRRILAGGLAPTKKTSHLADRKCAPGCACRPQSGQAPELPLAVRLLRFWSLRAPTTSPPKDNGMDDGSRLDAGRFEVWSEASAAGASYRVQTSSLKRLMDVFIAFPLLIFMSPLLIAIYVAIKLFDPGPALFRQLRVGRDGELFTVLKFRSMRVDAEARLTQLLAADPVAQEEWSRYQKLRHDPRVTFVGGILRKSSLDELPQLVNILRGEMSLIGPRPVTAAETHRYGSAYRFYTAVRPGVLGLWQVKGRNRLTYPQRVAPDVRYVTTWSIWQDLKICMLAIPVVLFGLGAY
jgi:exopolysaccharide production protein ExoY